MASPEFPPLTMADEQGCLRYGGELNATWLIAAYERGIFPWPIDLGDTHELAWFAPDSRAIIEWSNFHVSRRLRATIRNNRFTITVNQNFRAVMENCAKPRSENDGTWITPELVEAYVDLHNMGRAHSVETWRDDTLVGGVFGVSLGAYMSAESMFHNQRDASKVALAALVQRLQNRRFHFLDIQVWSPHAGRIGASLISREEFNRRLGEALRSDACFK